MVNSQIYSIFEYETEWMCVEYFSIQKMAIHWELYLVVGRAQVAGVAVTEEAGEERIRQLFTPALKLIWVEGFVLNRTLVLLIVTCCPGMQKM